MKILDITFKRKVNCSANVCKWNHWDHDHIHYTHKGIYKVAQIFYEDDRVTLFYHKIKIPLIPFFSIGTIDFSSLKDKNTVLTYGFQFGIPSLSTTKYNEISKNKCLVETNYKFQFTGLQILFYPLIKFLIPKWNKRTWNEDLPLKLRRQKVKKMNFKDFKGLPKKLKDRKFSLEKEFRLPIKRLRKSDSLLTKHPFYNFGRKDGHV